MRISYGKPTGEEEKNHPVHAFCKLSWAITWTGHAVVSCRRNDMAARSVNSGNGPTTCKDFVRNYPQFIRAPKIGVSQPFFLSSVIYELHFFRYNNIFKYICLKKKPNPYRYWNICKNKLFICLVNRYNFFTHLYFYTLETLLFKNNKIV